MTINESNVVSTGTQRKSQVNEELLHTSLKILVLKLTDALPESRDVPVCLLQCSPVNNVIGMHR